MDMIFLNGKYYFTMGYDTINKKPKTWVFSLVKIKNYYYYKTSYTYKKLTFYLSISHQNINNIEICKNKIISFIQKINNTFNYEVLIYEEEDTNDENFNLPL